MPREVVVGLVGIEFPIGERGRHDLHGRAVIHPGRGDADIPGKRQGAGPAVANDVDFHAMIVQLLGGTITAVRQFLAGHLGFEPAALLGEDHRLGIDQTDVGRGRTLGTEPLQEYREYVCQPVEAPHVRSVSREAWEPVGPIVAGMVVDRRISRFLSRIPAK
ncbi:MAG: hypothetical protein JNJ76_00120 [Candidatus Competibacter sp.]|nr:hypothetical protein [Candidatus Competibacter sp.]